MEYLDTIRKQDKQIAYLELLVDRIHPCLRRDCNYYNLDRIRMESHYNEEEEKWILPKMSIDRTALPMTGLSHLCSFLVFAYCFFPYHS